MSNKKPKIPKALRLQFYSLNNFKLNTSIENIDENISILELIERINDCGGAFCCTAYLLTYLEEHCTDNFLEQIKNRLQQEKDLTGKNCLFLLEKLKKRLEEAYQKVEGADFE